jgi:hypothetical protein
MPAPKEIEVKLELPPASLQRFKKIPLLRTQKGRAKTATEVSVYFDTVQASSCRVRPVFGLGARFQLSTDSRASVSCFGFAIGTVGYGVAP